MIAPGGPLRSREVRHLRVRVATDAGWSDWSEPATRRGRPARAGGLAGRRGHPARRPRVPGAVPGSAAAHGVRAPGRTPPGPAARHLARRARGQPQRRPGRRPPARPGLDRVRAAAAGHQPRRHRPARRRAERARRPARRRLVPRPAGLGPAGGPLPLRPAGRPARPARGRAAGRVHGHRRHRRDLARLDRRGPRRRPVRRLRGRPAAPPGGLGPARVRRLRLGAGRGRPARPGDPAAPGGPAGPGGADLPARALRGARRRRPRSTPARTSPVSSG